MKQLLKINKKDLSSHARSVLKLLKKTYPNAHCALNFRSPLEILVATILSAQCTDVRVNMVTRKLFKKYRNCHDYATVPIEELQQDIKSTGFYRNKAKSIQGACRMMISDFDGQVPHEMEEILLLPGVARKTANVVLHNAYGIVEGVVVDTHVSRLSQRLGLTNQSVPEKIEKDLMNLFSQSNWADLSYLLIDHGRALCKARKPICDRCPLAKLCPSAFEV